MPESELDRKPQSQNDKRATEATSDETLEDLEEDRDLPESERDESGPSPDGAFDNQDDLDDAGPM